MKFFEKAKNMEVKDYIWTFGKWFLLSGLSGVLCGLVGTAFSYGIRFVTGTRSDYPWFLYLLPVAGLMIVFLYRILDIKQDKGTNLVLSSVQNPEEKVPLKVSFLMFVSTLLTHLGGGSAGREGAALQIGAGISTAVGRLFPIDKEDRSLIVMCGMAGLFSALFGTPITAAIFSIEVVTVGVIQCSALFPCLLSSLVAVGIARLFHVAPESYEILSAPEFGFLSMGQVLLLGILCAAVSVLFCVAMHKTKHLFSEYIKNPYLTVLTGSAIIILLTLLIGNQDFNGAGGAIIEKAMEGEALPYAFLLKIVFTAITLGCGFKGGEIVPCFFIGSTFGCVIGPLLGLPASFAAGLGLIGVFCGCVNCPLASILLGVELFGGEHLLSYAIICIVSFLLSGRYSLYATQNLAYSKCKPHASVEGTR